MDVHYFSDNIVYPIDFSIKESGHKSYEVKYSHNCPLCSAMNILQPIKNIAAPWKAQDKVETKVNTTPYSSPGLVVKLNRTILITVDNRVDFIKLEL